MRCVRYSLFFAMLSVLWLFLFFGYWCRNNRCGGVITTLVCSCRLNLKMHVIFYCKQHFFEPFNMHFCIVVARRCRSPFSYTYNTFVDSFFSRWLFTCPMTDFFSLVCYLCRHSCSMWWFFFSLAVVSRDAVSSVCSLDSAPFMRWCVFIAHKIHDIIVPRTREHTHTK